MQPLSQMLIPVTIPTSPPAAMLHAPGMQYYAMPGPGGQPAAMASPPGVQTYLMPGQPYPQHMVMHAHGMNAPGVPAQTGRVPLAAAQTRQPVSVVLPSSSGQPGVPVIAHYRPLNVAQAGMAVRAPPLQPSYGAGALAPPLPQENYHHHHYQQQQAQSQQPPMLQQDRPLAQGMSPQAVSQASAPGTPTRHSPSSECKHIAYVDGNTGVLLMHVP